jgi:hypothetical protein
MKRRWNVFVWIGFLVILVGVFSYTPVFIWFPMTRDFPWANLLLFAVGAALLALGLKRAFRQPQVYRGRITGTVFGALSLILFGLFAFGIFYYARQLPGSKGAPQVGQKAPDFTLSDKDGNPVKLSTLLSSPANPGGGAAGKTLAVLLIFYRGYW